MSTTKDINHISLASSAPNTSYLPSPLEAKHYFYGLYSKPHLIARTSIDPWIMPRGPEAYFTPKKLSPFNSDHPLCKIWESVVGPTMINYLDAKDVKCSSLDPVRIGFVGNSSPPPILWVGVLPGSLTAEVGAEVAVHLKKILSTHGIDDVHVELRESRVCHSAKLYKPVCTSSSTVQIIEPLSTAIGLPISTEATPSVGGTGGFFISVPSHPGKLFLVTARHVIICPKSDDNKLVNSYTNPNQPLKKVLLLSDPAAEEYLADIQSEISENHSLVNHLEENLEDADLMEPLEDVEARLNFTGYRLDKARNAIGELDKFLEDTTHDWKDRKNRVIGHVVLSPPIGQNVGKDGFTEDWAVIEIDASKIDSTNFVGNAMDLGVDVPLHNVCFWMWDSIYPANPPSFEYPWDRLHKFSGIIPDEEIWKQGPNICHYKNNESKDIMVIKRGHGSGLTVGRLNTIRSFTRYFNPKDKPLSAMSKEVTVLPRDSVPAKSGPFSEPGDSGSSVVDGKGRFVGLLTGGAGVSDTWDCTYITSASFLHKRMLIHGLTANFSPS